MNRVDFNKIDRKKTFESKDIEPQKTGVTADDIELKNFYSRNDTMSLPHIGFVSGIAPYLRGPYSSMYVIKPWTIRQYAGFSTAEESNAFYRRNLAAGQRGLSEHLTLLLIEVMIPITHA